LTNAFCQNLLELSQNGPRPKEAGPCLDFLTVSNVITVVRWYLDTLL